MQVQSSEAIAEPVDPWTAPPTVPLARADFKDLLKRSDGPGVRRLAGHFAAAAATGVLVHVALVNPVLAVPAMMLHGFVLVLLFAPMHECTHGTAFRTRWLNGLVGSICGFVLLRPSLYFKWRHAAHHSYTQDPARDPDLVPVPHSFGQYLGDSLGVRFWPKLIGTLYRSATGRFTAEEKSWIPVSERSKVSNEARVMIVLFAAIIAGSILAGSTAVLWYWIVPRVLAEPALRMIRMVEHTGMDEGPDPLTNTRTTSPNRIVQFLYWNMPYHTEHHLAPSVPFHALIRMHDLLPDTPAPPSILRVHRDLLRRARSTRS